MSAHEDLGVLEFDNLLFELEENEELQSSSIFRSFVEEHEEVETESDDELIYDELHPELDNGILFIIIIIILNIPFNTYI